MNCVEIVLSFLAIFLVGTFFRVHLLHREKYFIQFLAIYFTCMLLTQLKMQMNIIVKNKAYLESCNLSQSRVQHWRSASRTS